MAHFSYPTFNILQHSNNSHHLTLASHDRSHYSPSTSPEKFGNQIKVLLPLSRPEGNDFQSNALVQADPHLACVSPPLVGLGIRSTDSQMKLPWFPDGADKNAFSGAISQSYCPTQDVSGDFYDQRQSSMDKFKPLISPSWSLSSFLVNHTPFASDPALNTNHLSAKENTLQYPSDDSIEWSLDSIATASGMSVHTLAEQLSSTAELALQYMSQEFGSSPANVEPDTMLLNEDRLAHWPFLSEYKSYIETTGLCNTDVLREEPFGINPADLMGDILYSSDQPWIPFPAEDSAMSDFSSHHSLDTFSSQGFNQPSSLIKEVHVDISDATPETSAHHHILQHTRFKGNKEHSDYELSPDDTSSRDSSPFPSPRRKCARPPKKAKKNADREHISMMKCPVSLRPQAKGPSTDVNIGTPVFDAHKGIDLADLKAKAERYRLRNPGHSYDNRWLVSFVGKLSRRGELVNEFRCYVNGCFQTNKRRDHILIHVGAHLDQRPHECTYCGSRFLRKNECKRHELSHTGARPFLCDICPDTAFVRQDLLKRHITRTHGKKRKQHNSPEAHNENRWGL